MNTVAYTAICGDRDVLRHTGRSSDDRRDLFVCFTDVEYPVSPYLGWRIEEPTEQFPEHPRLRAKVHQVLPHWWFPGVDVSLYMDGSHVLAETVSVAQLAEEYLRYEPIACFEHSERDCAYAEAEYCIEKDLDDPARIRAQMERYRAEGFPEHWGLPAITMLLRRHTPEGAALNELWWREIMHGSVRDQLSFPYCCWKLGLRWETVPGWSYLNPLFHYVPHGRLISEGGCADVAAR